MTDYAVTYASTGPRGQRLRTLKISAPDDASAREAARHVLALPTLTYSRCHVIDCRTAQERPRLMT